MPDDGAKAVIWDMDGVIVDSALFHLEAWQEVLQRRGVNFAREVFKSSFGQRNEDIIGNALGGEVSQAEIDGIAKEKEASFRRRIGQNLEPLPGAISLIKLLAEQGFRLALASSAPIENIQLLTRGLGIDSYFQSIVSAEDVTEGKPDPQVFLLAAQRLGVEPKNCIVVEDAITGVTAAKRAGMQCLAVTNTHPRTSLEEADIIVDTLEAIGVSDIERLLLE